MGLDSTEAAATRLARVPRAPAGATSAATDRSALAGRDLAAAQAPGPRRLSRPGDAFRRFVGAVRRLPERAASALQQAAHRVWAFPRHLASPARTDRFVMRRRVDRQLEALAALAGLPRGASAAERRRLESELGDATRALCIDQARADTHGRTRGGREAEDLCKARIESRLASADLPHLLGLLRAVDEHGEFPLGRPDARAPADAPQASSALRRVRDIANCLAYERITARGLATTRHAWEQFQRGFSGKPDSAALECAALARTLAAAVAADHELAVGSLSTPPGRDPNERLDIVHDGLLALGPQRLVHVLRHASAEVLAMLTDLFMDTHGDPSVGEMQTVIQKEIDSHARQQLERVADKCDEMSAHLQHAGAGPEPAPDSVGRRLSGAPRPRIDEAPEPLDAARTLLAFSQQAGLLEEVRHHCATCQIPLPTSFVPLRDRVRGQLSVLLQQPRLLVAGATASQLAQLQQLVRQLDVADPGGALAARSDALVHDAAQAYQTTLAALGALLGERPTDPARALRQAHAAATALCDLEDLSTRLSHEHGDPAREALTRAFEGLTPAQAAAALAPLAAQGDAGALDPVTLRSAADSDAAPVGSIGRVLRATARVLDETGSLLRARAGAAANDIGGSASGNKPRSASATSPSVASTFRELFGFDLPTDIVADGLVSGIFGGSFIDAFADKLESGMTDSEAKTLTIEGVVVPTQFHADAKRADKSTGMGTQFFLAGGQRLVDLDRHVGALEDDEVEHRVRESFDRLVAFYDGNADRARAVAALAHQGISAAFLQGMLFCSNEDNPFSVNGVTGTINHEGDFKAARMAVNITFDKTAEGQPLVHVDYSLDGGRIDDLDGRSVLLDPQRSRVHMRCSAVLEEAASSGSSLTLDGRIANRGRLRMLEKPHYSVQLVPRPYQRLYPEPARVTDLKPLRIHPDAVDGRETPEQTLRRSNMNRHLSQARDELMAVAHAGQNLRGDTRLSAKAEALCAIWTLPPLASAAQVEAVLATLAQARDPGSSPEEDAPLEPLRERVAAARLGLVAAFDDIGMALDARLRESDAAPQATGESSTRSSEAAHATQHGITDTGGLDESGGAAAPRASRLRELRRELDEFMTAPSFTKARALLARDFTDVDPDGTRRHRVQRLVDQLDSTDIDTRALESVEAPLASALQPVLGAMVANVREQKSFSPT